MERLGTDGHAVTAASSTTAFTTGLFGRLATLAIYAEGVHVDREDLMDLDVGQIFEGGLLFSHGWTVIDPFVPEVLGRFAEIAPGSAGGLVPEQATDRVYSLRGAITDTWDLVSYDRTELHRIARLGLPPEVGALVIGTLVRWGERGLAFLERDWAHDWSSTDGQLVILTTTLVEPPW